jgi:DNA-binding response OmpR family regulator
MPGKALTGGPLSVDSGAGRLKTVRGEPLAAHVLLIEDEPNIAEAIRFLLSRDGLRVSHAAEGAAALVLLRQDPPDLVILDHMLPGMSGLEILTAIRATPESRDLPVMMLTARGRDREMAERAGADRFMTKPFSNAEILAEVRAMLAQHGRAEHGRAPE